MAGLFSVLLLVSSVRAGAYLNMPLGEHGAIPRLLSQTGAFSDTQNLAPAAGVLPYDINVSFYSDGASKQRWIALPPGERITFRPTGEWRFPNGTVFIKTFQYPTDESHPGDVRRLETRLLVRDRTGGIYGVTYKWRPDNSDADLLETSQTQNIPVKTPHGTETVQWYYPSRNDCRTCHTPAAGLVLGVKARQLHRQNQLRLWSERAMFDHALSDAEINASAKLSGSDDHSASIEQRARSYIDANCSQCHRPGGVAGNFDARFDTPLIRQNLIDGPVLINLGLDRARVIAPNDIWRSVLLARMTTLEQPKMPPLAHGRVDAEGVELIRRWITSLPGPPTLAPPTIEPKGGDFAHPIRVILKHADPNAQLRYTLDGSPPGPKSLLYRDPIELTSPTTLRVRAFREGFNKSIPAQETFIVGD